MAEYGRELYTPIFIYIPRIDNKNNVENWKLEKNKNNGKPTTKTKFRVAKIETENGKIKNIAIANDKDKIVFVYMENPNKKEEEKKDAKQ